MWAWAWAWACARALTGRDRNGGAMSAGKFES